jgi:GLPGLI family protein
MKPFICLLICCSLLYTANAQQSLYISQGKIEFEKKLNAHAFIKGDNVWAEARRKATPKFKVTWHELSFNDSTTFYRPTEQETVKSAMDMDAGSDENLVYNQLSKHEYVAQKKFFDKLYLVKDSTLSIKWKITSEIRNIAGFECRRANAIIFDSVYIVAYYTDAILTPGGPESINGLPGMILGLAIPHEHVNWFATKVYAREIKPEELTKPLKGQPTNANALKELISERFKNWGKAGINLFWPLSCKFAL